MPGAVVIHTLAGTKKAVEACRLIEALYLAGRRLVVYLDDAGRAGILDEMLWTFSQGSFVPHVLWNGLEEVQDPVVIVAGALANPNGADTLVVAGRLERLEDATAFPEVHDLAAQVAEDADKAAAWRSAGFDVREVSGIAASAGGAASARRPERAGPHPKRSPG